MVELKKVKRWIVAIAVLFLVLSVSILFHEMGHVLALRHYNVEVKTVSVGYPLGGFSLIFWQDSYGTKYQITPFIILGYVDPGEKEEKLDLFPKALTIFAGPAFSLIFAVILISSFLLIRKITSKRFPRILWAAKTIGFVNLVLGIANLIVVFSIVDGGRILGLFLTPLLGKETDLVLDISGLIILILLYEKISPWTLKTYESKIIRE